MMLTSRRLDVSFSFIPVIPFLITCSFLDLAFLYDRWESSLSASSRLMAVANDISRESLQILKEIGDVLLPLISSEPGDVIASNLFADPAAVYQAIDFVDAVQTPGALSELTSLQSWGSDVYEAWRDRHHSLGPPYPADSLKRDVPIEPLQQPPSPPEPPLTQASASFGMDVDQYGLSLFSSFCFQTIFLTTWPFI